MELLVIVAAFMVFARSLNRVSVSSTAAIAPREPPARLIQLQGYADRLYSERKWLAAEKAYLSVLKIDHKNVTAYSHLGVIYSTQKNRSDAIECFQIAAQLKPSGTTYQNLGLAFFDNRNYMKAIAAYEKAVMFEPTANRYTGLSKAQRKLANLPAAIEAAKKAQQIEPSPKTRLLIEELESEHNPSAS